MPAIVLGSDHAGFELKEHLKTFLEGKGHTCHDVGCHSADRVDYPDFAQKAVAAMRAEKIDRALLCCGSGIGIGMTANRFKGIRAVTANDLISAKMSRLHNDSNVLCLGGRFVGLGLAEEILTLWLETPFEGGRHQGRVELIDTVASAELAPEEGSASCSI